MIRNQLEYLLTEPFFFADPSMADFNPYVVLNYVNYVRRLEQLKQLRERQERLRNATLEAQKQGKQLVSQGQQVNWLQINHNMAYSAADADIRGYSTAQCPSRSIVTPLGEVPVHRAVTAQRIVKALWQ